RGLLHRLPADREPPAAADRLRADGAAVSAHHPDLGLDRCRARGSARCLGRDSGRRLPPGDPRRLAAPATWRGACRRDVTQSLVRGITRSRHRPMRETWLAWAADL